jgi:Spy/CpxP family protein refolding chaperone
MAGVLVAGGFALAQGPGAGMGMGPVVIARHQPPFGRAFRFRGTQGRWWNNPRVAAELKLTDDQRKAMDQILFQHRQQLINLQANLERANLDMQPLMNADVPNEAAIDAQIDKVVQARADLERADAHFLLALRMKLTPEQWKQVQNLRARRAMMRRGPMRRGPMPQRQWGQQRYGQFQPQGPPPSPPSSAPAQGSQTPATGPQQ